MPSPKIESLTASTRVLENRGVIELEALDNNGQPLNFLYVHAAVVEPDLSVSENELTQIGPGRYQAEFALSQPGTYLIRLGVNHGDISLGQEILGLVVPYSPEYRVNGTDLPFLRELARITGGGELTEPVSAFLHNIDSTASVREIWQPLLLIVALLFPLDVAIRRMIFGRSDYRKAVYWAQSRLPWHKQDRRIDGETDPWMDGLFAARKRARKRQERSSEIQGSKGDGEREDALLSSIKDPQSPTVPVSQPDESSEDTLSRLRDAKKRARHEE